MAEVKDSCKMLGMLGEEGFEKVRRVYSTEALTPALSTKEDRIKILDTVCVGGLSENKWGKQYHQQDRVYSSEGIAMCHPANIPDGSYKYVVKEECCVAMRGRNPEKPTDRTPGLPTEQRLEVNNKGCVNTLTTVQKDNMILEKKLEYVGNYRRSEVPQGYSGRVYLPSGLSPCINARDYKEPSGVVDEYVNISQATKEGSIQCKVGGCFDSSYPDSKTRRGRVQSDGDVTPTLTAASSENINYVETQYRIRKLTPRECWRLMGYTDTDFDKAQRSGVSNTQLYKQAGNAIVKQVLMAIFSQMNIKGVKPWND